MKTITAFKTACIAGAALALTGCANPDDGVRYLQSQGYTQVQDNGLAVLHTCGKGTTARKFDAITPKGQHVETKVCYGLWKYVAPFSERRLG